MLNNKTPAMRRGFVFLEWGRSTPSPPRDIRKVKLIQRMPRLGVLELPPVLQKRLVAHHDHMALTLEVEVRLVVFAAG